MRPGHGGLVATRPAHPDRVAVVIALIGRRIRERVALRDDIHSGGAQAPIRRSRVGGWKRADRAGRREAAASGGGVTIPGPDHVAGGVVPIGDEVARRVGDRLQPSARAAGSGQVGVPITVVGVLGGLRTDCASVLVRSRRRHSLAVPIVRVAADRRMDAVARRVAHLAQAARVERPVPIRSGARTRRRRADRQAGAD